MATKEYDLPEYEYDLDEGEEQKNGANNTKYEHLLSKNKQT